MPRINLLPWRAALRQQRKKEFVVALVGAAVVGLGIAYLTKLTVDGWISNQRSRNAILSNEIGELQRARPEVVHLFDELVKAVPEGVHLTEVKQIGTRIELQGVAQSSTRVSTLMRNIDASEWITDPGLDVVQTTTTGPEHQSQFKLFAQQVATSTDDDAKGDAKTANAKPAAAKPAPAKPGNATPNKGAAK